MKKGEIITMDEETYWHFLGCVPPVVQNSDGYVCGEPYSHNGEGKGIYLSAIERDGVYYAKHGTIKEFTERQTFKSLF